jgi:hypothetical protein
VSALALFDLLWAGARIHIHADIDAAAKRAQEHVNRSAGQYRRYLMRKT